MTAILAIDQSTSATKALLFSPGGDLLDKVGEKMLARESELGALLAREEGKTLAEARGDAQIRLRREQAKSILLIMACRV